MARSEANSQAEFDVAIVGCGPVGATLANYISKFGHTVAIFDRFEEVFHCPRAGGLDDEALRNFQALGVLKEMQDNGDFFEADISFRDSKGNTLGAFTRRTLGDELISGHSGYHRLSMFHQPNIETALRKEMLSNGKVKGFLHHDVVSVTDHETHVSVEIKDLDTEATEIISAKFVVGCDGARSLVQEALGVDQINLNYTEDYLVIDAHVADETYYRTKFPDGAYFVLDETYAGVVGKAPHGWVRLDFRRHPDSLVNNDVNTPEALEKATLDLVEARGFDPQKLELRRIAPYSFEARTPSKWRVGRLLVAGDAAHLTPPWVGQGLNMGIRDAANIAFKLDMILRGKAKDGILDSYDEERRPVSLQTIKAAVQMGRMMEIKNKAFVAFRNALLKFVGSRRSLLTLQYKDWQKKPPYKMGFIGSNNKNLAGTWMIQPEIIDAKGNEQKLDDVIGLNFALITTFAPEGDASYRFVEELGGKILKLGTDISDKDGKFMEWFQKNKVGAVLVRPDRYIFDAGEDGNALCISLFDVLDNQKTTLPVE